ncbi:hypothetical protein DSO57_1038790 [Entomophthora muscae]|uniref:Uncharacterized protein n=1 Tax=Entomophthora muscae TaxID=34485 RepID=A0ACC2SBP1_9FUNG|nr:hypothetical protein DSO57_1038790 [Entomophthora muscae]
MADEDSLNRKSRARQACEPCRKKKTKCSGIEKRRGPQKGYVRALESRLDSLQNLLEDYVDKISPPVNLGSRAESLMDGGEVFLEDEEAGNDRSTAESSPRLHSNDKQVVPNYASRKHPISQAEISYSVPKKARSSDNYTSTSLSPSLSLSHPKKIGHLTMLENGSYKYMGENAQVFQAPLSGMNFSAPLPALGPDFVISKAQADTLIGLYFSTYYVFSPILIKDEFLKEYSKPDSTLPQSLIDAICAYGCAYVSRTSISSLIPNPTQLGEALYLRSRQKILSEVDRPPITISSRCFYYLRATIEMLERWDGSASDYLPGNSDPKIKKEREARRRLWWGCYILDRTSMKGYDTCFPEMEEESREIPYSASLPKTPSLENTKKFILKNIELWKIYGKVTRSIYSVRSRQGYSAFKLHSTTFLLSSYSTDLSCRGGSPVNPFALAYMKCKSAAIEITNFLRHPDAFIDLAAPFKFYPVLISFSIHLLGSSVSIADANLRASSKQHVVNYLTVESLLWIKPTEAVAKNRAQSSPSNKIPSPTLASQQPHFMNPTQFLQANLGKQSKMSSPNEQKTFTTQSDSIRPQRKIYSPSQTILLMSSIHPTTTFSTLIESNVPESKS